MDPIALTVTTDRPFDDTVESCRAALADQGFGVLTEIDIAATLKNKLQVDRAPYTILGACHPPSAHKVLDSAPEVGVLLPCNVTISVEEGRTVVRAMNPGAVMTVIDNPVVAEVAADIGERLERALGAIV